MQATITKRFLLCALVVLGTTVLPWLFYGKYLYASAVREEEAARKEYDAARLSGRSGGDLEDAKKKLADAEKKVKAYRYELKLGLDLKGGASITYRVRAEAGQKQDVVLRDAIGVIRRRIDAIGVGEVNILESGVDRFTVELPGRGKEEIDRIKAIMQKVGSLEFRIVALPEKAASERMQKERDKGTYVPTPGYRWYPNDEGGELLLEVPDVKAESDHRAALKELDEAGKAGRPDAELAAPRAKADATRQALEEARSRFTWTGADLESASAGIRQEGGRNAYEVQFSIVPSRKTAFGDYTGANIERQMAIVLNGSVHSAPVLKGKLPGSGSIFNDYKPFTAEQAQDMVTVLKSGSLAVKPEEISSFVVGPGLGEEAVRTSRWAIGVSCLLVVAFMAFFYHGAGWVANLAVLLNLAMTIGVLMFLGAALSLPGIAGLLLTLGMAVDANILVNERIREEKNAGKGLLQAVTAGYERDFITILDSNLTTVITAAILYFIGTGPIRGFALTLILGIFISMFTALYVTRTLFLWGMEKGILTEFRMAPVYLRPEWDWMARRRWFFGVSLAINVVGTAAFALRPVESKYDLEFTGGQRVVVALKSKLGLAEVHRIVEEQKLGSVAIRTVRGRGADAEKLNLSTESDSFELTAPIGKLAPDFLVGPDLGEKDTEGLRSVHFSLNFGAEEVTAEAVRELVASAPVFAGTKDLSVAPDASRPGACAFVVDVRIPAAEGKDPRKSVAVQIQEAERERESSRFTERVRKAFESGGLLVPPAFTDVRFEPAGTDGLAHFRFTLNLATPTATVDQLKAALASAPLLAAAKELKVEAGPAVPGARPFVVEGKAAPSPGKDPALLLEEQAARAVHDHPDLDLSEPIPQSDFIGPGVARTLRDQAILAVLLSILAQIVYLRVRFRDFTYGVAAAIALVHDVLITLGALAVVDGIGLAHLKINLPVIAAFLTLIGYSMNDTIVVFDRIRENLGRSTHPGSGLINGSINQTLARSIRTSMTVWLVAVVLFVFNMGAASSLEGFAFVMVIGVLTGTYSSVAIAAPLLLFLPVYGANLRKLGNAMQAALFATLVIGLLLAIATDGTSALVGAILSCLLPAHFLWALLRWLPERDPDGLVRGLESAA